MLTTLRAMWSVRSRAWATAALVASTSLPALACSPMRGLDLAFSNESAELDATSARKLGNWIADLRTDFPKYENFSIAGHVDRAEQGGLGLAVARAASVRRFLTDRGFRADRVNALEPGASYNVPIPGLATRAVAIDFLPACPHQCCKLPTHKVEGSGVPMP